MSQLDGNTVLVRYDAAIWDERYILAVVEPPDYIVVSPDDDVYSEQLDLETGLRFPPTAGALLAGIGDTYSFFPRPTEEELGALLQEGAALAMAERAARGLRPLNEPAEAGVALPVAAGSSATPEASVRPLVAATTAASAPGSDAGSAGRRAEVPAAAPARRVAGASGAWVLDESAGGLRVDDEIFVPAGIPLVEGRAFVAIGGSIRVVRHLRPGEDLGDYS